ncbi:MAG: hypothetical protein ACXWAA_04410, partial [Methylobacter sp.]
MLSGMITKQRYVENADQLHLFQPVRAFGRCQPGCGEQLPKTESDNGASGVGASPRADSQY